MCKKLIDLDKTLITKDMFISLHSSSVSLVNFCPITELILYTVIDLNKINVFDIVLKASGHQTVQ